MVVAFCRDFAFPKFSTELIYSADEIFRCSIKGFAIDSGDIV